MESVYSTLWECFRKIISVMKSIEVWSGVSLFHFLICLMIVSIVVAYLINTARAPSIDSSAFKRGKGD